MTVPVAAAVDLLAGEPPAAVHPVVWIGRALDRAAALVPEGPPSRAMVAGGAVWLAGASTAAACGFALRSLPFPLRGLVLSTLGSGRLLFREVADVEAALGRGLPDGRAQLSRIVSRPTGELTEAEVRASALESLAENLTDSVVAPLFWYSVAGLPGAALYRFANTADAMWGYRTPRWEHAGKVAARADDLLNLVPARLTALLLNPQAGRRLREEARRTPSPNGGWPMGALALALDVRLPKPGHYVLNPSGREPTPDDTRRALRSAARAAGIAVLLSTVFRLCRKGFR